MNLWGLSIGLLGLSHILRLIIPEEFLNPFQGWPVNIPQFVRLPVNEYNIDAQIKSEFLNLIMGYMPLKSTSYL
jgi:hypothetical protein